MYKKIKPNVERIRRDIESLSEITDPDVDGHTRISFSEYDRQARTRIRKLMEEEAGLRVRVDAAANMIGYRAGQPDRPCIMVGSHLDTVPSGGRFDGIAGVVAGLEVARRFKEENIVLQHPLEVVVFLAEEPSPFGISTIGSRAMAGKLNGIDLGDITDSAGRTLFDAIRDMGGDPENIGKAQRFGRDILLNLELHIEQGPQLYTKGIDIGIVTGIVGIYRGNIEVSGRMDHAGTTPMGIRNDALTAAAEVILALENICRQVEELVGTTGTLKIYPNAANVVPSRVDLGMEVRCLEENKLEATIAQFKSSVDLISLKRQIDIKADVWPSSNPVIFDQKTIDTLAGACRQSKIPYLELSSGAGHDASHMAEFAPTGMLFIPCKEGRSHCPEEWSEYEHVGRGVEVLANTILTVDKDY
jgi:N-carbamoyl-L-amino-acid hydrolase